MSVPIKNYLTNRRNRMVGSVMGYLEKEIIPALSKSKEDELRRVVRDAINSYHDSVLDLMKGEDGVVRNDEVVHLLEKVEKALRATQANGQTGAPSEPMHQVAPHGATEPREEVC